MAETSGSEAGGRERRWRGVTLAGISGLVLSFVVSGVIVRSGSHDTEQPVRFNHRIHVVENEMACTDCHEYYEEETFSGLPARDTCEFCHAEPLGESAEERRLVELLEQGAPLEWRVLFRQPPHVFYSHRRHVVAAELECIVCHGAIGESTSPPRQVRQLTMDDCTGCHEERDATAECTTCHR